MITAVACVFELRQLATLNVVLLAKNRAFLLLVNTVLICILNNTVYLDKPTSARRLFSPGGARLGGGSTAGEWECGKLKHLEVHG